MRLCLYLLSDKVKVKGQECRFVRSPKVKVTIFGQQSMDHYIPTIDYIYTSRRRYTKLCVAYNFQVEILGNCDHVFGISNIVS